MIMIQHKVLLRQLIMLVFLLMGTFTKAQENIFVDLSRLSGQELTPDNIVNFSIVNQSGAKIDVAVNLKLNWRQSGLNFSYSFNTKLDIGQNEITKDKVKNLTNQFSSAALKELFLTHKKLPQGNYELCVSVFQLIAGDNEGKEITSDCMSQQVEDLFMINLINPDNGAKIYEHNPMFSWVVTYPLANDLTYRIRITDLKKGQSSTSAMTRNPAIFQQDKLMSTSLIYPITAKPLEAFQPYVWTVDAYYKGILLGGAEYWKFTIIEDSTEEKLPKESSYVDINIEEKANLYYAVGCIKVKYSESEFLQNELSVYIIKNGKKVLVDKQIWKITHGDNFKVYDLSNWNFKHKEMFELEVEFKNSKSQKKSQIIKYKYVNPEFVQ